MKSGMIAAFAAAMFVATLGSADAHVVVDISQFGKNVVVTGSGTIDLTDPTFFANAGGVADMDPADGNLTVATGSGYGDLYVIATGSASFGTGKNIGASSSSGDFFGVIGPVVSEANAPLLIVPDLYVSGSQLSGSSTYDGATLASLGATPGTYVWTWGSGSHADSMTVVIGAVVPEPSTWAMMAVGFAGLGFAGYRSARRTTAALVTVSEGRAAPCLRQN
jgi:PEP-CTERM motif